jgi:hypothetical protein
MENLNLKARGESLKDLTSAMEEDDAKSIPTLMLRITSGPEGIEIEKGNEDGSFSSMKEGTPEEEGNELESGTPEQEKGENELGIPESKQGVDGVASQDMGSEMPEGEPDDSGRSMFEMIIAKKKKEAEGR